MTVLRRWITTCLAMLLLCSVGTAAHAAEDEFLEPDKAFPLSARALDDRHVELTFNAADGYYMYGEQFRFTAQAPVELGPPQRAEGKRKYDENFGREVEIVRGAIRIVVPVQAAPAGPFEITTRSQGCADKGLCYAPMEGTVRVSLKGFGAPANSAGVVQPKAATPEPAAGGGLWAALTGAKAEGRLSSPVAMRGDADPAAGSGASLGDTVADEGRMAAVLRSGQVLSIVALFFGAGVLLSFTPCVLPMVPILSSIIVGEGRHVTRTRGGVLAASYALGMALVYTALGVAAGLAGEGLAAWLQTPWVLGLFAAALVALSLSMFGFYELQPPAVWRDALSRTGPRGGGKLAGVFVMGAVSALIVSPCVAAPLAGALLYVSQSRDALLGGLALFVLAMGMSVPLLLVGVSAGHVLPRAGAWMESVKHLFGVLLLGVALWIVQPVLPVWLAMLAWGVLLLVSAVYLHVFEPVRPGPHAGWSRLLKGLGAVLALLGTMQLIGAASGARDPLQPLAHFAARAVPPPAAVADGGGATASPSPQTAAAAAGSHGVRFERVASLAALEQRVKAAGRPVMLDFWAEWCVSCKEMEKFTFTDEKIRARLDQALLLQADVTANSPADRELLKRFRLFGPPGIVFFDAQGREMDGVRVIGFQDAERFGKSLSAAGL